jgi:GntR family transcriptional regulator/MocR family aminotransferase
MLPWITMMNLQKDAEMPVFLQLANGIIREIKNGILKPGSKMPGTRMMADALKINRQTVVNAYDELDAQGWIVSRQSKGSFISHKLPEFTPKRIAQIPQPSNRPDCTGYSFTINTIIHEPAKPNRHINGFHDGPDVRLVPAELLSRGYKSILSRKSGIILLSYAEVEGRQYVRKAISDYLNSTRGLQTKEENLLITRGAQMAMYLLASVLISKNDIVVTANLSFRYADICFLNAGATIVRIPVDEDGIDVDELEKICRKKTIRAIYVTSHHHYPTTVTLCAARRMKLIHLAEQYGFIIIEDDYDYEFHYESSPILPLASVDKQGMVVYIGSFSKTISPSIRIGYIAAPPNLIMELSKLRMILDVQGDPIGEQAVAELLNEGQIRRHMKKVLKVYKERRDFMVNRLKDKLSDVIDFKSPEGGLSIWARFDNKYPLPELSEKMMKKNLVLSKGLIHDLAPGKKLNSTRMGFGWMNINEADHAITVLEETIKR